MTNILGIYLYKMKVQLLFKGILGYTVLDLPDQHLQKKKSDSDQMISKKTSSHSKNPF